MSDVVAESEGTWPDVCGINRLLNMVVKLSNSGFMASLEEAGANTLCGMAVGFRLRQRALHVYSEKERVPLFKQICDGLAPAEEKTEQLARLMNDSQASCRCLVSPCQQELCAPLATPIYM